MKKFLFGILGLLFAMPAVADLAPCRNLFDNNSLIISKLNDDGTITDNVSSMFVTPFIPVQPNTTYTLSYNSGSYAQYRRIAGYNAKTTESFTELIKKIAKNDGGQEDTYVTQQFITGNNTNYIILSNFITDTNIQLEQGSTATAYVPFCANQIKIATTAYNAARFSPVVTDLNDTIATIRDVVTNTINQTKAIADLQATKQTRPDENCPAGKKCLLVEDDAGQPHWYEIIESASLLPDGFTELQYIESTGTQYIDTGAVYKSSRIYNVDFQYVVYPNGAKGSLGARQTSDAGMGTFDIGCNSTLFYFYNNSTNYATAPRDLARHTVEIDYTNSVFKFDGETLPWTAGTGAWQGTYNIYIGRENIAGSPNTSVDKVKWYSYKVYDNGVLIQNLIPAKNSSGVIGMYDLVSGQFLTNQGTGTFVDGPVVQ